MFGVVPHHKAISIRQYYRSYTTFALRV